MDVSDSVGAKLRQLRGKCGVSLSELSRRSGIGKGTISELENDRRGARLDTLFALTTALNAPLSALIPDVAETGAVPIAGASVTAVLLGRWVVDSRLIEVYRATLTATRQDSPAHGAGVEETVTVVQGRVLVGADGAERELGGGESLRYRGDLTHHFQAVGEQAEVILLMHYPTG